MTAFVDVLLNDCKLNEVTECGGERMRWPPEEAPSGSPSVPGSDSLTRDTIDFTDRSPGVPEREDDPRTAPHRRCHSAAHRTRARNIVGLAARRHADRRIGRWPAI